MSFLQWIHKFLYKNWRKYGHAVYVPSNDDWSRFIERRLGGDTGLYGNPRMDYKMTRASNEFCVSKEMRAWAKEQKIWIKFYVDVDNGNATYPRDRHLVLSFIFLTREDAAQFKLTFL
jgi:hypothetical protein